MEEYRGFRDLIAYQKSYKLAMEIFEITKGFPNDEKYSLTNQLRRCSRSVPANIAEAWVKRKYPKSFMAKLLDALAEESETEVWLDMSLDFKYIDEKIHKLLIDKTIEVSKMLNSMIKTPEKFCKT